MKKAIVLGVLLASSLNAATVAESRVSQAAKGLFPSDWHILIVPESNWLEVKRNTGTHSQVAFTNLEKHITVMRERFAEKVEQGELRFTLAHEAGHVACGCYSEELANQWAHIHE